MCQGEVTVFMCVCVFVCGCQAAAAMVWQTDRQPNHEGVSLARGLSHWLEKDEPSVLGRVVGGLWCVCLTAALGVYGTCKQCPSTCISL